MTHDGPERPTDLPPTGPRAPGGIVHSYLGYDPKRFPSPTEPAGDSLTDAAMDHLMTYGSYRPLTDEELAEAVGHARPSSGHGGRVSARPVDAGGAGRVAVRGAGSAVPGTVRRVFRPAFVGHCQVEEQSREKIE